MNKLNRDLSVLFIKSLNIFKGYAFNELAMLEVEVIVS
jgi:hypothetical protein